MHRILQSTIVLGCFIAFVAICHSVLAGEPVENHRTTEDPISHRGPAGSGDSDVWRIARRCGANCTFLFASLAQQPVDYAEVMERIPIGKVGTSLADIKSYLKSIGLSTKVVRVTPEFLQSLEAPSIALLEPDREEGGHFVIVLETTKSAVKIIDGTSGDVEILSARDFNELWTGYLLVQQTDKWWKSWVAGFTILFVGSVVIRFYFLQRPSHAQQSSLAYLESKKP